ncbi:MAG: hypothetical protein EP335_07000 [Alphaproteobacteria bacterium]|nr:MAG: hypothetical protein EP335_07000 [Alphaproteobacteria bacterium]
MTLKNWLGAFMLATTLSGAGMADAIDDAVNHNPARLAGESDRDSARHPAEFLRFAGIEPDMAVAEVNPGGGWYSRILGPLLKDHGQYVGLEHSPEVYAASPSYAARLKAYPEKFEAERALFGDKAVATWIPASEGLPMPAGSLDAIMVVRAMHNWHRRGFFDTALEQSHAMLKSGGVLAVVQHRANEDDSRSRDELAGTGRWKQSDLIAAIEAHGFKLVDTSEMNANPKDTKDYPEGVWTLPPVLALKDKDRDHYLAIGESDRMTLKFVKVDG